MARDGKPWRLLLAAVGVCGAMFLSVRIVTHRAASDAACESPRSRSQPRAAPGTAEPIAVKSVRPQSGSSEPDPGIRRSGRDEQVDISEARGPGEENARSGTPETTHGWKDIREEFPHAFQWTQAFMESNAGDGIKNNCSYLGHKRGSNVPLIVGITGHTTPEGFQVDRAELVQAGHADEYQATCVVQWVTGSKQALPAGWVEAGRAYRFSLRFFL